jgi:hypothetical protein
MMVAAGVDIGHPRINGGGRWHLTVSAMDDDEIMGNGHLMDAAMDFGKEVERQRQQRLQSMAVAAGE